MTRRRRHKHHTQQPAQVVTPAPKTQEPEPNPTHNEPKQSLLSYLSVGKGFLAASLGYFTTLSQILPTSAQTLVDCVGFGFVTSIANTCYWFNEQGVMEVNGGYGGQCSIDVQTKWIFSELGKLIPDGACGNVTSCTTGFYPDPIGTIEQIILSRGYSQSPQLDFEACAKDLIAKLANDYDDGVARTWITVALVFAAVGSACALGLGLNYARKQCSAWLEQRRLNQERDQAVQVAKEDTHLFAQL